MNVSSVHSNLAEKEEVWHLYCVLYSNVNDEIWLSNSYLPRSNALFLKAHRETHQEDAKILSPFFFSICRFSLLPTPPLTTTTIAKREISKTPSTVKNSNATLRHQTGEDEKNQPPRKEIFEEGTTNSGPLL